MFNGRDDNANRTPVFLTLADNSLVTALIRLPLSRRIEDALNNADVFLDTITPTGQQQFFAKSSIRSVRSAHVPKADQLDIESRAPGTTSFDPYAVLKVGRDASRDEIKLAYHKMAQLYHPDRVASYELPDEVMDYVRAMLVRINLAFEQIGN